MWESCRPVKWDNGPKVCFWVDKAEMISYITHINTETDGARQMAFTLGLGYAPYQPKQATYQGYVGTNDETGEFELTVVKTMGQSGPFGDYPVEIDARMSWNDIKEAAVKAVHAAGYYVASDWEPAGYAGIMVAELKRPEAA